MGAAIRKAIARVYNTLDKLKYDTDNLDIRDVARDLHTVRRLIELKSVRLLNGTVYRREQGVIDSAARQNTYIHIYT